jgi:hypothetical protein
VEIARGGWGATAEGLNQQRLLSAVSGVGLTAELSGQTQQQRVQLSLQVQQ